MSWYLRLAVNVRTPSTFKSINVIIPYSLMLGYVDTKMDIKWLKTLVLVCAICHEIRKHKIHSWIRRFENSFSILIKNEPTIYLVSSKFTWWSTKKPKQNKKAPSHHKSEFFFRASAKNGMALGIWYLITYLEYTFIAAENIAMSYYKY